MAKKPKANWRRFIATRRRAAVLVIAAVLTAWGVAPVAVPLLSEALVEVATGDVEPGADAVVP